jgi:hypothetical protein
MISEKMCLRLCRFRDGFNSDPWVYGQKIGSEKVQSFDILQDPTRIFNDDKPSFHFCPKGRKVLKCKGTKMRMKLIEALPKRP